jgi:hypothetical protein
MSRSHGRVLSRIWDDREFVALDPEQQRMYLFLLSQPDLSHAGLIPLRLKRWASRAAGQTSGDVLRALKGLAAARFVLVDEDTEEVLIRTLVRNDQVYKQPKVMIRMGADARQIASPALRAAFVAELRRLPLHELDGAMQRRKAEEVVMGIIAEFGAEAEALEPMGEGFAEGYPEGFAEGYPEESADGYAIPPAYARAHSPFPQPPAPVPHLLTLVGRLAGSDARANGARLPAEVIESWQRIAGPDVDLEAEAAAYFARQGGRPARDEAAAWVGWLRQANRHAARARGAKPPGCRECLSGWLPEPDDPGFASSKRCPKCKPAPATPLA